MQDKKQVICSLINIEGISQEELYTTLVATQDSKLGDYALPCFKFAKLLRKSPMVIANELANTIVCVPPVTKVEAVNGYLNFFIDKLSLAKETLTNILDKKSNFGDSSEGKGKTICIDYSSINIAKPFHIGHLCTTVLGGSLYRIYKKLGYDVVGINHLGDWGTQFGKLIVAFKLWCSEELLAEKGMKILTEIYVKFHEEAEKDPTLDDQARSWFKRIEEGDSEALHLYNLFKEVTLKEVKKVYDRLNITFDSYNGEAFYNDKMQPVLDKIREKHLMQKSEGAELVNLDDYNMPPCLLVKGDGATLYATRDLAAAYYRKNTYDFYKCLYVVAYQQNLHFKQFFKVLELLGEDWAKDLVHVAFGMVSLEDGAMSTRKGKVVLLEDALNKAVEKSKAIIKEKNPNLANADIVAEQVGVGSVIFFTLYNNRIKDMCFSYDKVLSFEGETGVYVQYTNARTNSLLEKIGVYDTAVADFESLNNTESAEVIKLLADFNNVIKASAESNEPCYIGRFLVNLCQAYNRFYFAHRIVSEPVEVKTARAMLSEATHIVIEEGLRLLGISAPQKM